MARLAGLLGLCVLISSGVLAAAAGEQEDRIARELVKGRPIELDLFELETATVFELSTESSNIQIRAAPDGLVQFLNTTGRVQVTVTGAELNRVIFELRAGQQVSVWPIERLTVHGKTRKFKVAATAAGWAFVVRADKVGRDGLDVLCDGLPYKIPSGLRIDCDRRGKKVVFRLTGRSFPGRIVMARERRTRPVSVAPEVVAIESDLTTPGVLLASARDFPWQSIPLPVLSWEVFRPADVSP